MVMYSYSLRFVRRAEIKCTFELFVVVFLHSSICGFFVVFIWLFYFISDFEPTNGQYECMNGITFFETQNYNFIDGLW